MLKGDNDRNLTANVPPLKVSGGDRVRVLERVHFEQMSPRFQEVLLNDLEVKYTLKGEQRPKKRARRKIEWVNKRPQTRKSWRRLRFLTLQSIDRNREKLGLKRIHFP